jgi:hypothetical protein
MPGRSAGHPIGRSHNFGPRVRRQASLDGRDKPGHDEWRVIPACQTRLTLHPPRPSEGRSREALRRRDEVRCPCGLRSQRSARGGAGLPPGPLRGPARSWLTTVGSISNADDRLSWTAQCAEKRNPNRTKDCSGTLTAKAGPVLENAALARREAPAVSGDGYGAIGFALFGAPPPHVRGGNSHKPDA